MPGLPKKALKQSQLKIDKAGTSAKVNDGSHQIFKATFNENGQEITGFYKKLAPERDYPELLAKISVAVSLFKRTFQGRRSAEERLVFDKHNNLVGTFSINVEGFKPFNFSSEPVPADPVTKESAIPSTKKLIETNMMEILFGRWFLDDDDGHPHNISLAGDIDYDMFLYWFTIYIKNPRPVVGVPKTSVQLTILDWEQFPSVKDSKPFHWPTYTHPGEESIPTYVSGQDKLLSAVLPKIYADPSQFANLAGQAVAQEQKMAAALKALLTYQPEIMRKRLVDLFGDLTLNYTALSPALRKKYEEKFPELCTPETDTMLFVDFIMKLYQRHYDNLYRVVVYYRGCANNGFDVPLPATSHELYLKPSYFKNIGRWVSEQNQTGHFKDEADRQLNLEDLQKRYHQVWRDAFAPSVKELLHGSYQLTKDLLQQVSTEAKGMIGVTDVRVTDANLTDSWQYFGKMSEISVDRVKRVTVVDKESNFRQAMELIAEFTKEFHDAVKEYYEKQQPDLTEHDNLVFCEKLNNLYTKHNLSIRKELAKLLGHTSSYADEFNKIAQHLRTLIEQVNFQQHLTTTDEQMKSASSTFAAPKDLPLVNSPEVKTQYIEALFAWAKEVEAEEFSATIIGIIDEHYNSILSNRFRAVPVKDYLARSKKESGDVRLAYILSSGNEDGTGTLNEKLIQYLCPHALKVQDIPSVSVAQRHQTFKKYRGEYAVAAADYAKKQTPFIHLLSDQGMALFYRTMYEWIDAMPKANFNALINSAVKDYISRLSMFSTNSREAEVKQLLKGGGSQSKIVALIFVNGTSSSTLNATLFKKIIEAIKTDMKQARGRDVYKTEGYKLIKQYHAEENQGIVASHRNLVEYAQGPAHSMDSQTSAAALS